MDTDDTLLRRTLRANAAISLPWGVVAALGAGLLAEPLGTPVAPTVAMGVVAIGAALLFGSFARREHLRPFEGWLAAVGDLTFGAVLVVAAVAHPDLTTLGRWLVGLSGAAVVDLGLVETVGTRRLLGTVRRRTA